MTILSVCQNAALAIGVERPDAVMASTTRSLQELASLAQKCARMIAFETGHDWTALKTLATIAGDGATLSHDLPSDYKRMLKKATVWSSADPFMPFTHYADTDEWLGYQLQALTPVTGAWTLIGSKIELRRGGSSTPIPDGETAKFYYITDLIVSPSKTTFTADSDTFVLDENVLELALIYRWKQGKGQDYAEELSDYQDALAQAIGSDKGSNILKVGRRSIASTAGYAYPYPLGE